MERILAIDYGDVRVGVAVSDPLGITAQGLDTITINGSDKKFMSKIKELILKYGVKKIVIGYPRNMDGSKSQKTDKVDSLVPSLQKLGVSVIKWDERLTTVSAYKTMKDLNISQKKKNIYADKLAATYILEGYLNSLN